MAKIVNVVPNDDYTLEIQLNNHHKIIYDMKPRLKAVRFCGLAVIVKLVVAKSQNYV